MSTIGERIRNKRREQNLTLDELSAATGIPKSTIQRWESGAIKNMGQEGLLKLSKALDTTVFYLQTGESSKPSNPEQYRLDMRSVFTWMAKNSGYTMIPYSKRINGDLLYLKDEKAVSVSDDLINLLVHEAIDYFGYLMSRRAKPFGDYVEEMVSIYDSEKE